MNDEIRILSIQVGKPSSVAFNGKPIFTGIMKQAVVEPIFLGTCNFEGDGQADLKHHGGADKAVCVYESSHFAYWQEQFGLSLQPGAFGENITTYGLTEHEVCIGDRWQLGDAVVEVSQPRQPCYKLAQKHNLPELVAHVQSSGRTGYYYRVIQTGYVSQRKYITSIITPIPTIFDSTSESNHV